MEFMVMSELNRFQHGEHGDTESTEKSKNQPQRARRTQRKTMNHRDTEKRQEIFGVSPGVGMGTAGDV
jgi:hypothetical protein